MNFPPVIFYNQNFSSLFTNNYTNQNSSSLIPYQTLCKKLLKFENKDPSFQSNVITWIKSLNINQLIKYFSFKNQWIVDILHEMILIYNSKQDIKFQFIQSNSEDENKEQQDKKIITYINFLLYQKECPKFTDFFIMKDEGLIYLSRRRSREEKLKKKFIDNIRYITLPSNSKNNINNYNNNTEIENEKLFIEFNNVITLSYDYLSNIDELLQTFLEISKKECFKNPIELASEFCNTGKKYYYNFKLPNWLGEVFTLPELLCAFFEQSLLINYQYYLLYKQEINFLYFGQLDDLLDNIYKLVEFIENNKDKKVEIMQNINPDKIKSMIYDNQNIKKIICDKKAIEDNTKLKHIQDYRLSHKLTIKTIINKTLTYLEKLFINMNGELKFVLTLTFIKDSIIFTTEDFVLKNVYDIINIYRQNKAAEELIHEFDSSYNFDNKKNRKKKKKKKKKKNNDKNDEIEDNKDNCINNQEEGNEKENDKNSKDLGNINIINIEGDDNEMKKNGNLNKEIENEVNENINNINNDIDNKDNLIIENEDIISNINKETDNKLDKNDESEIVINDNNHNIKNNEEKNLNTKLNEKDNNNSINNEEKEGNNKLKDEIKKNEELKEELNEDENISENNQKKKKEKNFFLYPTIKDKKKKNKQNKKKDKIINNNNNINNINNESSTQKQPDNNNDDIKPNEEEQKEILIEDKKIEDEKDIKIEDKNEIIIINSSRKNSNDDDNKEKYKKNKNGYEYISSKQKNKFNIGMKLKNMIKDNSDLIIPKNYQPHDYNYNKLKIKSQMSLSFHSKNEEILENNNNIESSSMNQTMNYLAGSNNPRFTSFNFQSKKNRKNYKNKHNNNNNISPYSFISNNILEFSKEIIENTIKVNKNKEILQQIREKYIKQLYEKINIILIDEKIDFLCSFYGSSISGLSIENSDIDILVKLKENKNENNYVHKIMNKLVDNLKKSNINFIINIMPIFSASVPVIKIECDLCNDESFSHEINTLIKKCELSYNEITKLYFDITFFEVENEQNKIPTELMIDFIKEYTIIFPQIIDIVFIMKRFLFNRKLNKSYQGGISSYSLFLLTLAFVKYYKNKCEMPIGSLLIEYLNYYTNFDFYNTVIQPNKDDNIFSNIEDNLPLEKYNLNIIDPITGLSVAKSTFKIDEIQKAFREGLENIISNLYTMNNNNIKNHKKILDNFFAK